LAGRLSSAAAVSCRRVPDLDSSSRAASWRRGDPGQRDKRRRCRPGSPRRCAPRDDGEPWNKSIRAFAGISPRTRSKAS